MMVVGILAMLVLPVLPVDADKAVDSYAKMTGVKVVTDSNVDVTYTGKHWKEDGEDKYEYIARIHQAPIYNEDGSLVDCSWHGSEDAWVIVDNVFSAQVIGSYITVTYQGKSMSWNPVVMIDSKEYVAKGSPKVTNDILNENYHNNVLEWDYGVCVRRVRVIEGLIQETWTFSQDPKGNVWIRDYAQTQKGFDWAIEPYGYDADGNPIAVNEYKQVAASVMASAVYPVTIDPTEVFVTSASDGYTYQSHMIDYNWVRTTASASNVYGSGVMIACGQAKGYAIYRGYVYFDTSAIPDSAVISSAILSLRGYNDYSTTNFNVVVQNGQPTYPHDPLVVGDYDYTKYSGTGSSFSTAGYSTAGYNNISLTAEGLTFLSVTGTTKLCIKSSRDIAGNTPTGSEYITVWAYEKGAGYRPYLTVVYVSSGPPDVTSVAASYVTKTTARANGYLDSDGGEATTVWFNYWEWYDQNWSDCIEFSINASYVDSDLTNFPVLITGAQVNDSNPNFWTTVDVNGSDILFTDEDGNKLYRELVSIDTTNMSLECYVNVTTIDDAIDTPIYMYYGANVSTHNDSNSVQTWDNSYVGVWHFNDDPDTSTIQDSTSYGYDGTKKGANEPLEVEGRFAGDKAQYFDGSDDYISLGDNDLISTVGTWLFIVNKAVNTGGMSYIGKYSTTGDQRSYMINSDGGGTKLRYYVSADGAVAITPIINNAGIFPVGEWTNFHTTYNGSDYIRTYKSSILVDTQTASIPANIFNSTADLRFGKAESTGTYLNGSMTEVRISNISITVDWIKAEYYSLMSPEDFCPVTDVFHETATQSKNTGDSFYSSLTGLTADTLYGFRAMGTQTQGMDYGAWLFFDTSVTLGAPSNALCNPTSSSIGLTWFKGGNTSTTFVRWKTGGYPSSTVDGTLLCNTSDIGYVHSGLTPGTTYYYRLWGQDSGEYSATNTTLICTTLAGTGAGATPEAPPEPDTWTDPVDETTIEDLPIYAIGNVFFDSFSLPHSTGWMAAAFGFVMASGFIIYSRSKNLLVAILTVMIFSIILSIIGMLPMWAVYCFAFTSLGMSWKELR
jgi:hypothetical protein